MATQRAVSRRSEEGRQLEHLELTLIDNNAGNFISPTLQAIFTLEIPELTVADIAVSYAAGGHRVADVYEIHALRRTEAGDFDVATLHSVTEGQRRMPEQWRLLGPMFVRVTATATGNGPIATGTTKNHLLAGVTLSPAVPMCNEDWKRLAAVSAAVPTKTFSSQD